MYFYFSKLNFIALLAVLALLNACSTQGYYAPVTSVNQIDTKVNKNLTMSEQDIIKGDFVITQESLKYPPIKNRRTFHATDLNSDYGYQHHTLWNRKSPSYNLTVGKNITHTDHENRVTDHKQRPIALTNEGSRHKKFNQSVANTTSLKNKNTHKKQQTAFYTQKKLTKKQQKSIISIDNNKKIELNFWWPIKGKVLKSFSPSGNKGIDIAGKKGQLVRATETGKVVYGGQGLIGFGKLLIIKHPNAYLSAYANNSRLLVDEGQQVQKGQVIAEVGNAGIKRTSLHFEIRKNGKPVNPLKLLPKK